MLQSKPCRKRTYDLRWVKATYPYEISEIAKRMGVHKNAIGQWIKQGLRVNKHARPRLIRGDDLIEFIGARQTAKKRKCGPREFYCFKCRTQRRAYLDIVDLLIESGLRVRLKAICGECSTKVNKVQSLKNLPKIRERFHVQQQTERHLRERAEPSDERALDRIRATVENTTLKTTSTKE